MNNCDIAHLRQCRGIKKLCLIGASIPFCFAFYVVHTYRIKAKHMDSQNDILGYLILSKFFVCVRLFKKTKVINPEVFERNSVYPYTAAKFARKSNQNMVTVV